MTTYSFDESIVSDLHKDALGFRPSSYFWDSWNGMTDDQKQAEWDYLIAAVEQSIKDEEARQERAIEDFGRQIDKMIALGAKDRDAAIRWIVDALGDCNGDPGYVCYLLGLPYHMEIIFKDHVRREAA